MDTSQGTRAKKTRYDRFALGKQKVKARPLIIAGIYFAGKIGIYFAGKYLCKTLFLF
jgi:hypothetical protein